MSRRPRRRSRGWRWSAIRTAVWFLKIRTASSRLHWTRSSRWGRRRTGWVATRTATRRSRTGHRTRSRSPCSSQCRSTCTHSAITEHRANAPSSSLITTPKPRHTYCGEAFFAITSTDFDFSNWATFWSGIGRAPESGSVIAPTEIDCVSPYCHRACSCDRAIYWEFPALIAAGTSVALLSGTPSDPWDP